MPILLASNPFAKGATDGNLKTNRARIGVQNGVSRYGLMGLLLGFIFAAVSMLGGALAPPAEAGMFRMFFGVGAIVFLPVFYGVIGGIFGALGAPIYNLAANWVGGLEVDIG